VKLVATGFFLAAAFAIMIGMRWGGLALGNGDVPETAARAAAPAEFHAPVAAARIATRDLSLSLSTSGMVEPHSRVRLASRASGIVAAVMVEVGDPVRAGAVLARIDMSEEEAELARARAEMEQASRSYERTATLYERGTISSAEYEGVRLALEVARRQSALWETRIGFGEILSPIDATVTARHIEPGEGVDAQELVFELSAMDLLVVRIGVSELDVAAVEIGQPAEVVIDALGGRVLEAHVRRIFPVADAGTRLVTVEIALPVNAAADGVRMGFLARVRMQTDTRPDAVTAPSTAVAIDADADGGTHFVLVIDEDRLHRRAVTIGVQRGDWTEIIDGLQPGETVLASDPSEMREGEGVRIVSWRQ